MRAIQSRWHIANIKSVVVLAGLVMSAVSCAATGTATRSPTDNATELDARLLRMVDTRAADTLLVGEALRDVGSAHRARAALAIGQAKIGARYAALRHLLVDPDTAVAANAAYALGIAKDTAGISALARAVAGAPDVVAREAAWSLGEIGDAARLVVTIALGDGTSKPLEQSTAAHRGASVRAALLLSAARMRPVPVGAIQPWFADGDPEVVRAAAYAFGRARVPAGVRALLTVQSHADEETRQHVARGLARSATGDSLATSARRALATLQNDPSPRVRMNAVRSVASYGSSALTDVEKGLTDADANVRVAASEGIQTVFLRDTSAWNRAWRRDTTFRVRQQLLVGARAAGMAVYAEEELLWLRHPDWQHRIAAIDARTADTTANRLALVREMMGDRDARVQAAALQALPASTADSTIRGIVMPFIDGTDVTMRATALRSLARRAHAGDVGVGMRAYAAGARDADSDARMAALQLIRSAWMRDSANVTADMRQQMTTISATATATERKLMVAVTPLAAWAAAAPAMAERPLADYQRLVRQWYGPNARQPQATIYTDHGEVVLELFGADAPLVVESFVRLARAGYYRNTIFHRVVPNFVVQDGDGSGAEVSTLRESYSRRRHDRGAVGLATAGPDTGGSQYYLCHASQPHLDGGYTVFGRVLSGFDVMDRIVQGDRMLRIEVR